MILTPLNDITESCKDLDSCT